MEKIVGLPGNLLLGPGMCLKLKLLELFNVWKMSAVSKSLMNDSVTKSVQEVKAMIRAGFSKSE